MPLPPIEHAESQNKGQVFMGAPQDPKAAMTYTLAGESLLIIDHTEVDESLRGQGVGHHLLHVIVGLARERGVEVMPLCPFARHAFEKDESIRDVLRR